MGAAGAVRADYRDLGQPAQPADVVAHPVAIVIAEQRRIGVAAGDHVAAALGQTGSEVTRRHYLTAGAEQDGKQRAALRVITGGRR